jgi:hypothetical protein
MSLISPLSLFACSPAVVRPATVDGSKIEAKAKSSPGAAQSVAALASA